MAWRGWVPLLPVGITAVAVVIGAAAGLVRGGRWRHLAEHRLMGWPLLIGGVCLQLAAGPLPDGWGLACLLVSYLALALFVVFNLARTGMAVVLVGLVLNAAVIGLNGGMPVRRSAVVAAGGAPGPGRVHVSGKHHLARPDDHLVVLADVIPLRPFHEVVALGDVLVATGLVIVVAGLFRPPYVPQHRRRRSGTAARLTGTAGPR